MTQVHSNPTTRRRPWSEHPASLFVNVSWALSLLIALVVALLADAPLLAWIAVGAWIALNIALTAWVLSSLRVPLESARSHEDFGISLTRDAMRRLFRNQMATLSMVILLLMMAACFAQSLTVQIQSLFEQEHNTGPSKETFYSLHFDHTRTTEGETYQPPSTRHWFGTDTLGRDLFARTLYGGSISFLVGIVGTIVSVTVGVIWGSIAGYRGGRVDEVMMRLVDILYGLPFLFLVILILTLVNGLGSVASETEQIVNEVKTLTNAGKLDEAKAKEAEIPAQGRVAVWVRNALPPIVVIFVAIGLVSWLTMARIVRGQVLSLKEREFVTAARSIGARPARIVFTHIVPNLLGPVIVYSTLTIPEIMLSEAFLSFIGLGISEPNCSWGSLASEGLAGVNIIKPYWWLLAYPAGALCISLFCLNFIGDGLRDALDPRSKR